MSINQEFKSIISRIKYEYSLNQNQIADRLDVKRTYLSDMINGRVPYNEMMNKRINAVFPTINEQSSYTSNETTFIAGNGNHHMNAYAILEKAIEEIAEQRKVVAKAQEQIDRLISLLEKK